jgi:hypothetical protein
LETVSEAGEEGAGPLGLFGAGVFGTGMVAITGEFPAEFVTDRGRDLGGPGAGCR